VPAIGGTLTVDATPNAASPSKARRGPDVRVRARIVATAKRRTRRARLRRVCRSWPPPTMCTPRDPGARGPRRLERQLQARGAGHLVTVAQVNQWRHQHRRMNSHVEFRTVNGA